MTWHCADSACVAGQIPPSGVVVLQGVGFGASCRRMSAVVESGGSDGRPGYRSPGSIPDLLGPVRASRSGRVNGPFESIIRCRYCIAVQSRIKQYRYELLLYYRRFARHVDRSLRVNGGGWILSRELQPHARRNSVHVMSIQMAAGGLVALLVGVIHGVQYESVPRPRLSKVSAQISDDDHRLVGQLDEGYACYVNVTVEGVPFRMLVDTGSDDLAFNSNHLRKLGLNAKRLNYSLSINTPNGIIRSAQIEVHELRIGTFVLHDVAATVDYGIGSDEPLLGMSVIKHMHLEIGRDGCELRW